MYITLQRHPVRYSGVIRSLAGPRKEAQSIRLLKTFLVTSLLATTLLYAQEVAVRPTVLARASFYANKFENRPMAGGGRFHQSVPTAASLRFPLGTLVRVHSISTGRDIVVRVTDRGPWTKRFGLDLSRAAFTQLGLKQEAGWGWVLVTEEKK
jgi:rare lipoprotein A